MITDDFNRANGGLGANWADAGPGGTAPQISTNRAIGGTAAGYSAAYYSGSTWSATHSSKITSVTAVYVAPAVRMKAGGNWIAYFDNGSVQQCVNSGTPVEIAARTSYIAGDVAKLSVSGLTLTPNLNGTDLATITLDGTLTDGSPGIAFYDNTPILDNWEGTGESGATPDPALIVIRRA